MEEAQTQRDIRIGNAQEKGMPQMSRDVPERMGGAAHMPALQGIEILARRRAAQTQNRAHAIRDSRQGIASLEQENIDAPFLPGVIFASIRSIGGAVDLNNPQHS
jgi:hypothetical protein